jgi:1-acyl-sn-glycerol-3-phosphate acyltransferase
MDMSEKTIDIEKVIRRSKSRFVRSLPKFVVVYIKKLIRQDEMNEVIFRNRNKTGVSFVNGVLRGWKIKIEVKGRENVPDSGRFVFVANHPVGGMDALGFLSTVHSFFPDVVSPSNELFNYIPNLSPVILGVNVFGTNTKETVKKFNRLFESDSQIMIFPAGIVSRKVKGVISDPPWQKTFITKSVQFKRDIIPVHISGRNSNLFYNVDRLRKFLGIKMSVEIILLPRVTFTIGKPIPWQSITSEKSHVEWARSIKEAVYQLPGS